MDLDISAKDCNSTLDCRNKEAADWFGGWDTWYHKLINRTKPSLNISGGQLHGWGQVLWLGIVSGMEWLHKWRMVAWVTGSFGYSTETTASYPMCTKVLNTHPSCLTLLHYSSVNVEISALYWQYAPMASTKQLNIKIITAEWQEQTNHSMM